MAEITKPSFDKMLRVMRKSDYEISDGKKSTKYMLERKTISGPLGQVNLTLYSKENDRSTYKLTIDGNSRFCESLSSLIEIFKLGSPVSHLTEDTMLMDILELLSEDDLKIDKNIFLEKTPNRHERWVTNLYSVFKQIGFNPIRLSKKSGQRDLILIMPMDLPPFILVCEIKTNGNGEKNIGSKELERVNGIRDSYSRRYKNFDVFGAIFTDKELIPQKDPQFEDYKKYPIKIIKEDFIEELINNLKEINSQKFRRVFELTDQLITKQHFILLKKDSNMRPIKKIYPKSNKIKPIQLSKSLEIPISFNGKIGTDEAGKGDYFGPLVVAGFFVKQEDEQNLKSLGVKDSKLLSDTQIFKLERKLKNFGNYIVVKIMPPKYNELQKKLNLNKILAWGHARVIENILGHTQADFAIADQFGDKEMLENSLLKEGRKIKLIQITKGGRDISIAAASIIARAEFLRSLSELSERYRVILPKGAVHVVEAGKQLIKKYGKDVLSDVAKLHFKTTKNILD